MNENTNDYNTNKMSIYKYNVSATVENTDSASINFKEALLARKTDV